MSTIVPWLGISPEMKQRASELLAQSWEMGRSVPKHDIIAGCQYFNDK